MSTDPTHEVLTRFASVVWHPDDIVEVRCIWPVREDERGATSRWVRAGTIASDAALIDGLLRANAGGWGIYVGANPRRAVGGRVAESVALARCLFVDFDGGTTPEQALQRILECGLPPPSAIVNSGHGTHSYWRLEEPLHDLAEWTRRQQSLIARLGTDKAIHDPPRVMRLPGFMNTKQPAAPCLLVECHPGRSYSLGQFPRGTEPRPAVAATPTPAGGVSSLSRSTLMLLQFGAPHTQRHDAVVRAACDMAGCSVPIHEAEAMLSRAVVTDAEPRFTESECRGAVQWAYSKPRQPARSGTARTAGSDASGGSVGTPAEGSPESWPEPQPLPTALPPVMAFDAGWLPERLRAWIVDIAERVQCPIDFVAVAAMVALSSLVGRKVGIRPKRFDDWLVVPNLWGGVIGRPGVMKTPAIQEPLKPLQRLEIEAKSVFDSKAKDAKASELVEEAGKREVAKEIRKHLKNPDEALRIARESITDEDEELIRKRYLVNDSTVEKLGEILNENPMGVLVFRDELIGLLKNLDKEGQESARAFFLEAWNGTGRFTFDRIGRGTIDIDAAIVSILGGIQPGPLAEYFRGAAKQGIGDDGLMQRFQLLVWPDISREWVNVDRWPDTEARKRAFEIYEGLDQLEPALLGVEHDPLDVHGIGFLRFDDAAQIEFDRWRADLERTVRAGDLHPAMESHLAKFRSLIPSLALILHLADGNRGPVGAEPLRKAISWDGYLRSHARRVYSQAINPGLASARALAKRILDGQLETGFALRDVYRKGWSQLANPEDARNATEYLTDLDWLVPIVKATAGRDGTTFLINPNIRADHLTNSAVPPPNPTDKGDRSPSRDPSGSSVSSGGGGVAGIRPAPGDADLSDLPDRAPPSDADGEEGTWTA